MSKALDLPLNCWRFSLAARSVPIAQLAADHPPPPPLSQVTADKWPAGGGRINMPGNDGGGGCRGRARGRSQPPPPRLPLHPGGRDPGHRCWLGRRGRGAVMVTLAPGTLSRGLALHAPAAAWRLGSQRSPSSPPRSPGRYSEHPPRLPPSPALYGSFKAAAAT